MCWPSLPLLHLVNLSMHSTFPGESAAVSWCCLFKWGHCYNIIEKAQAFRFQLVCPRHPYWDGRVISRTSTVDTEMWHWMCSSRVCLNGVEGSLACLFLISFSVILQHVLSDVKVTLLVFEQGSVGGTYHQAVCHVYPIGSDTCQDPSVMCCSGTHLIQQEL